MSEAASATKATIDVATGEVVGGLAGLREIIRMKQELDNKMTEPVAQDNGSTNTAVASVEVDNQPRKSRRRGRRRQAGGATGKTSDSPEFTLPIKSSQIVYAEIIDRLGVPDDVRMYVSGDGRLYVHTSAVYAGQARDYCEAAKKLLADHVAFDMAKVADVQLFINKHAELTVMDDFLVYMDKYRIDSSNEKVFNMAKKLLSERDKRTEQENADTGSADNREIGPMVFDLKADVISQRQGEVKLPKEKLRQVVSEVNEQVAPADVSSKKDAKNGKVEKNSIQQPSIVGKVARIQELATQAASGEADITMAMEVFLLVGEASPELLVKLLHIDHSAAVDLVDHLRLMHAIGHEVDGEGVTYPILIDSLTELGTDVAYTLQSAEGNFHSVVDSVTVRGKELYYDLDAVLAVQMADEYIHRVAEFCRVTRSRLIAQLFSHADKRIPVSQVLQVLSGDGKDDIYGERAGDFALFHSYVTGGMLTAGWLVSNPSDGYPWVQFQVDQTHLLACDTLRYIIANAEWLVASYDIACIRSLIGQIERLELTDDDKVLRQVTVAKLQRLTSQDALTSSDNVDAGQLSLDNYSDKSVQK